MSSGNPFAALLKLQRDDEQRAELHRLRDELGLRPEDALWRFVALVEEHCAACQPAGSVAPSALPGSPPALVPGWVWLCAGMASQVLVAALCVLLGARASGHGGFCLDHAAVGERSWLLAALSVPAGWMGFLFALPAAAFAAHLGWRLQAAGERAWGYVVMVAAVGGTAASALALWRIM